MNSYDQRNFDRHVEEKIRFKNLLVEQNVVMVQLTSALIEAKKEICELKLALNSQRRSNRILVQRMCSTTDRTCGRCGGQGHIASNASCPMRYK
jgi:hypothetical protein